MLVEFLHSLGGFSIADIVADAGRLSTYTGRVFEF